MDVFVIVEMFKGGIVPEIRGVYQDEVKANEIKNDYRFAFIDKQKIIQTQEEKQNKEVFVVMELLKFNVPRIVGVYKNNKLAEEMASCCECNAQVIKMKLILKE